MHISILDDDEYNIYLNDKLVFKKSKGYSGGGWCSWDYEDFYVFDGTYENSIKSNSQMFCNDKYEIENNTIKVGDILYKNQNKLFITYNTDIDGIGIYYDGRQAERGLLINNSKKIIVNPNEKIMDQVSNIFNNYTYNAVTIYNKISNALKDSTLLPISEYDKKQFYALLDKMIIAKFDSNDISRICNILENIKNDYNLYINRPSKKSIMDEIEKLNNILIEGLSNYIQPIDEYNKELKGKTKKLQMELRKKYGLDKSI